MKNIVLFVIAATLVAGCASSKKLYQKGDYEGAIRKSVKKLSGNPNKSKEAVILEKAYNAANSRDQERIKYLRLEGKPESWDEVFRRYSSLKDRQSYVKTVLPLNIEGRTVNFPIVDYDKEIIDAKNKAAEYYYVHGQKLLATGNRFDAREAYQEFSIVKQYFENYMDVDKLMIEAANAGMTRVKIEFENNTWFKLSPEFSKELLNFSTAPINSNWMQLTIGDQGYKYHYLAKVNLKIIDISPEKYKEREYTVTDTIQDGWDLVLDANNNTVKDSLGNPIKKPRMVIISCKVLETLQQKAAHVEGTVDYINLATNQIEITKPVAADYFFENISLGANGDLRALSPEQSKLVGKPPLSFPVDAEMVMGASGIFKQMVYEVLKDTRYFIK